MRLFTCLAFAWAVLAGVSRGAEKPGIEQVEVFIGGELGYMEYRIPTLVVTAKGTLLAITEAGKTSSDYGDRDLLLRRSDDGGRTWTRKVEMIIDRGKSRVGSPAVVVDRQSGRIHLLTCVDSKQALHTFSDDDGKSWARPRDITPVLKAFGERFEWNRADIGPGLGIVLARGKHKGRFVQQMWLTKDEKVWRSGVIYSDDRGKTWKPGGLAANPDLNTNECTPYEGADGTLYLNLRGGGAHAKAGRRPCRIAAKSTDGGLSWTKPEYDENLIGPQCLAATCRYSWPEEGRGLVLFSNPADEKQRINMTIRVSYDDGRTWPVSRQIYAGPSAYSCLVRLPSGDVGLLYERGKKYRYAKMTFARIPIAWLESGTGHGDAAAKSGG